MGDLVRESSKLREIFLSWEILPEMGLKCGRFGMSNLYNLQTSHYILHCHTVTDISMLCTGCGVSLCGVGMMAVDLSTAPCMHCLASLCL